MAAKRLTKRYLVAYAECTQIARVILFHPHMTVKPSAHAGGYVFSEFPLAIF